MRETQTIPLAGKVQENKASLILMVDEGGNFSD